MEAIHETAGYLGFGPIQAVKRLVHQGLVVERHPRDEDAIEAHHSPTPMVRVHELELL